MAASGHSSPRQEGALQEDSPVLELFDIRDIVPAAMDMIVRDDASRSQADHLVRMIRESIAPESWERPENSIGVTPNGLLLVSNASEVIRQISGMLTAWREGGEGVVSRVTVAAFPWDEAPEGAKEGELRLEGPQWVGQKTVEILKYRSAKAGIPCVQRHAFGIPGAWARFEGVAVPATGEGNAKILLSADIRPIVSIDGSMVTLEIKMRVSAAPGENESGEKGDEEELEATVVVPGDMGGVAWIASEGERGSKFLVVSATPLRLETSSERGEPVSSGEIIDHILSFAPATEERLQEDRRAIGKILMNLDADEIVVRDKADRELLRMGRRAQRVLGAGDEVGSSEERKSRLERVQRRWARLDSLTEGLERDVLFLSRVPDPRCRERLRNILADVHPAIEEEAHELFGPFQDAIARWWEENHARLRWNKTLDHYEREEE